MSIELFSQTTLALICGALIMLFLATAGQLRSARKALANSRATLVEIERKSYFNDLVIDSANDGLVVQSLDGLVLWANPTYFALHGRSPKEIIGRNPLSYCMPIDEMPSAEEIAAFRYEPENPNYGGLHLRRNQRGDGSLFWNQMSVSFRTAPDGTQHAIVVCRDVTEQVENEEKLRKTTAQLTFSATHDALTSIPNRKSLVTAATQELCRAAHLGTRVGLLQIDVDFFKEINEVNGHLAGDATLVHISQTLKRLARSGDHIARVGGDEFILLRPDVQGLPEIQEAGEEIARALEAPFEWNNLQLMCKVSIGVALSQAGAREPEELIQHSDFALSEVKRTGRGRVAAYDEALHLHHLHIAKRGVELSEAVFDGGLSFLHQPVIKWDTQQVLGFETLVRWDHPTDGVLRPSEFLPLAASLGLQGNIDIAAMEAGLALKMRLSAAGFRNKIVSFNASAEGLLHPDYAPKLQALVARNAIEPEHVTVEVLEATMFNDKMAMPRQADIITELRRNGFLIVLDDFGVGPVGLAHLAELNLSGVKIDQSLASKVLVDKASSRIVATVVELCADLGLDVIANGAETPEIAQELARLGCHILQGHSVERPMTAEDAIRWVHQFYLSRPSAVTRQHDDTLPQAL
ncbi:putative bifunctional diguanylate cyclase/phosphodiesterase [Flavimaricola marinus]|uniref:Phytochrome-like protein cph2 n=1 Tax=Flavimaricola marinus TaxID=1819565 RepID=A0A238L8H9_9RHOB|nr:EAL domain-containing protein [Flavimaricola marinus]SMY05901.1 Phytochrome-like protein cph2 [Flavimaricola marinus]